EALAAAGITTLRDLLWFFPFRYEDRRHPTRVADLGRYLDTPVLLRGKVISARAHVSPRKRMKIFEAVLEDGTGAVKLVWFNQPYLAEQIARGDRLSVFGAPRYTSYSLQIDSPDWEKSEGEGEDEGSIVPIYSKVTNVAPKALRQIIGRALDEALPDLDDPMPPDIRERLGVIGLPEALAVLHRPPALDETFLRQRSPAHLRILLQQYFTLMLAMRVRRATEEVRKKERQIEVDDELRAEVRRILPFKLTNAQRRVVKEIVDDLTSDKPMYRLLQGDVGSGKTIVALIAAIVMIRNGHQVALLAPTEILAEQHYQRIRQLVDHTIVTAKATGSMTAGERRTLISGLREGYIQLAVGTHALLEEKIRFQSLGLAIVDEQHRFGVEQRQALFEKAETPDILVMTATPIPRSLALAMYGDLELSVIDELPPGRQVVKTVLRTSTQLDRVWKFIDDEIDAGAQTYIVYPIIEESEKSNLRPLTAGFESMQKRFPNRRIAMLHGRMPSYDKEETMARFKRGDFDILVSTTVIEVGIDVPNASMMVILDADRFGLSQLHQLRGRVGRGERKSYCVTVCEEKANPEAVNRLKMFEQTRDGFDVAERDLEIRGPGEFLGTRQSGVARFHFGNILRDHALLEKAQRNAIEYIDAHGLERANDVLGALLGVTIATGARD
ncbi:MAG TPA: ATP-dependent DNA helicase RecG, partial [Thermoanaerobaculia bacterium]|nr:ATP-dependent DNA helicase RecG [Thermoanaerobaculia bacterium]